MSKLNLISFEKRYENLIKTTLEHTGICYKDIPIGLFECIQGWMFLEVSTQYSLSYYLTNIYEIYGNNPQKKEFDKVIDSFKDVLMSGVKEIILSVKWVGDNSEELNETYNEIVINLANYFFPEDKFEFDFNVNYKFIYR